MSEKTTEQMVIEELEDENRVLGEKYIVVNELLEEKTNKIKYMKIELVQNRLFTCSILIMTFIFSMSLVYWTTQ